MEKILHLYRHPSHKGLPSDATHSVELQGRRCGDQLILSIVIDDGRVNAIGFDGACCAVTTAATSLFCDAVDGGRVEDAAAIDRETLLSQLEADLPRTRYECVELPIEAFRKATAGESAGV